MKRKSKSKLKGFVAIQGVLLCILLGMVSLSFLQIYSGQFAALAASRKGIQAQQFAQSEADLLRNTSYDTLSGHARKAISGATGWTSQVTLGSETTLTGDVKQRLATIQVYRNSTATSPDFSLQVPLSSAGAGVSEGEDNLPVGTILPYQGSVSDIPEKWALCDGLTHNGVTTPNLLDGRFLEGSSTPKEKHDAGLPNITGSFQWGFMGQSGYSGIIPYSYIGVFNIDSNIPKVIGIAYSGDSSHFGGKTASAISFNAHRCSNIYRDDITTVQPKSYTVKYIMKIKA